MVSGDIFYQALSEYSHVLCEKDVLILVTAKRCTALIVNALTCQYGLEMRNTTFAGLENKVKTLCWCQHTQIHKDWFRYGQTVRSGICV